MWIETRISKLACGRTDLLVSYLIPTVVDFMLRDDDAKEEGSWLATQYREGRIIFSCCLSRWLFFPQRWVGVLVNADDGEGNEVFGIKVGMLLWSLLVFGILYALRLAVHTLC